MSSYFKFDSNNPTIRYAASELKAHLSMLPYYTEVISADDNDHTIILSVCDNLETYGLPSVEDPLYDDQFTYQITKNNGYIYGRNSRSVLLAVYYYLREIGFHFIRPGIDGTFVPNITDYSQLIKSHTQNYPVRHRGICIEGANSTENILEFIDWLPKLGYNSFFMQFKSSYVFLERWYSHQFNPYLVAEPISDEFVSKEEDFIIKAMLDRGLLLHRAGHGWTSTVLGIKDYGWNKCTNANEDTKALLALINGKREFLEDVPANTNLCYSNKNVVHQLTQAVVTYAQEHSEVDYIHFWLADEYNNFCECQDCVTTTPSDQYIHLLNEIDSALTQRNLKTKIVFLLYQELLYAPIHSGLKNPERFTLMFAPISRTFEESFPIEIPSVDITPYTRNQISLPVTIAENISFLREWQTVFNYDSFLYDYPMGRAHYGDFGYMKISKVLCNDIKVLPSLGLNGYISCQELRVFSPTSLPNYVMGLILENPNLAFDEICQDYFDTTYGPAGSKVQSYLDQLSAFSNIDYINGKFDMIHPQFHKQLECLIPYLIDFQDVIQEEIKKVDSQRKNYWILLDYHSKYVLRLSKALLSLTDGDQELARIQYQEFCTFIQKNEVEYQSWLDVYRMIEVTTKYTGFRIEPKNKEETICTNQTYASP